MRPQEQANPAVKNNKDQQQAFRQQPQREDRASKSDADEGKSESEKSEREGGRC